MNAARKKLHDGNSCPKTEAPLALFWNGRWVFAAVVALLCAGTLFAQTPQAAAEPEAAAETELAETEEAGAPEAELTEGVEETGAPETELTEGAEETGVPEDIADGSQDGGETISYNLRRNKYFLESLRQRNLANLALSEGEYEMSETYSAEAVRYAQLSDEYIAEQLKRQRATRAVADARRHLEWAKTAQAPKYYPDEYESASEHYSQALAARDGEDWDNALAYAMLVENDLAGVAAPPVEGEPPEDLPELPSKYTVRPWDQFGDCFWNIAYWFYGDYSKWPLLFEANRDKLPDRDNPDLVEVGTIIDIPPVKNEVRLGMWDSGRPYKR
jgi:nucleoid-associated protein YgaU